MMEHELKTWPEYFAAVVDGRKRFEVRKDDRGFELGDKLVLREFSPLTNRYSGHSIWTHITYVLRGGVFGIEPGYVVLGIADGIVA